jgi:peptidoglycan/LPS O-acetylase OafA/YrhL
MTHSVNRAYIPEIDHLRGFAALMVFLYHSFEFIGARLTYGVDFDPSKHWVIARFNPIYAIIQEGHSGVGLFIVLSGFILSIGCIGNKISYPRFILSRICRIYPILVVCLAIAASINPNTILAIFSSLLPLNVTGSVGGTLTTMFWAVWVEFQCYLVFPFLIMMSNARGSIYIFQIILISISFRYLAIVSNHASISDNTFVRDISYWTISGRFDQFCIGILLGRLYSRGILQKINPLWLAPALIGAGGSLWLFNIGGGWPTNNYLKGLWPTYEGLMWACVIAAYLSAGSRLPSFFRRLLAAPGEISYSFYLIHFAAIMAAINLHIYIRIGHHGYLSAIITALVVVLPPAYLLSALCYNAIELPFLGMRPKYITRLAQPTELKLQEAT